MSMSDTDDRLPVANAEALIALLQSSGHSHVKIGVTDIDGVLRGKYMARDKLISSLSDGFGFCDVVLGWDTNDQLYDNTQITGWHRGYGDAPVRILPGTTRDLATEPDTLIVLGEFGGEHEAICPRAMLRRVLAKAETMGLRALAACEYEFLVVEETATSLAAKRFRDLAAHGLGNFGYSMIRNSVNTTFYRGLLDLCETMRMPLEGLHEETGPGALEAAIRVSDALEAADRAVLFKTYAKVLAQRNGLFASFMAKWDQSFPGQGGHVHVSLTDLDGAPAFGSGGAISTVMRHFIGGLQVCAHELAALSAPTVNSYRRLVPGYWAPTAATWGVDNRTVAIRAISGGAKSQRVEYRVPGADTNPYLTVAATLGAGLWGIEHAIEPNEAMTGNAYVAEVPDSLRLPATLHDAAAALRGSAAARALFGDAFVDHFAATREWEEREFRRHVSDWELKRYFEII